VLKFGQPEVGGKPRFVLIL